MLAQGCCLDLLVRLAERTIDEPKGDELKGTQCMWRRPDEAFRVPRNIRQAIYFSVTSTNKTNKFSKTWLPVDAPLRANEHTYVEESRPTVPPSRKSSTSATSDSY